LRSRQRLLIENLVLRQQLVVLKRRHRRPRLDWFDRLFWLLAFVDAGQARKKRSEVRDLIFQMVAENPTWGAPRIHGELLMLGFDISERTISRWMKQAPKSPEPGRDCSLL
jgi:putative transposase